MGDLSNHDDAALLAEVAQQNRAAFAELFGRYAGRVKAFLMSGGAAAEDADEVAQEVMASNVPARRQIATITSCATSSAS
ncbi:MAG: hypothetical protein AAFY59_10060, partial [Pseudomonadota bacterium]